MQRAQRGTSAYADALGHTDTLSPTDVSGQISAGQKAVIPAHKRTARRAGRALIGAFVVVACGLSTFDAFGVSSAPRAYAASPLAAGTSSVLGTSSEVSVATVTPATPATPATPEADSQSATTPIYRLYNRWNYEHLYTTSKTERDRLVANKWRDEGVGWTAPTTSNSPVFRLYNPWSDDHHYTMSPSEVKALEKAGWRDEGTVFYSVDWGTERVALYRQYNPYERTGSHNFTLSSSEHAALVKRGWRAEGAAWYAIPTANQLQNGWVEYCGQWQYREGGTPQANRWVVTQTCVPIATCYPGYQRYWCAADGTLARDRFVQPSNASDSKAGYIAFATPEGYVACGKYPRKGGGVYLADGDGRLELGSGWIQTKKYDGSSKWYYLDGNTHLAQTGMFKVAGKNYYGYPNEGYIATGERVGVGNTYYQANKNGVLTTDKVANRLIKLAQRYSSPSKYLILIDIDNPRLVVMEGKKNAWKPKYVWDCDTGKPSTPTIEGVFHLGLKGYSFGESRGYSCYWWSQISGNYLMHTRLYVANTRILLDGTIGQRCSEGCVRGYDKDIKWIWDNVPSGTTIVTTY